MGMKSRSNSIDSSKMEVGEIDTRAPFESVKAAVSLFGEVAFSSDRSSPARKLKSQSSERVLAKETELHLAQKELNKYKEQLNNAETTRIQALEELQRARKTFEELTTKLNTINESKELALKATEAAKNQTKKFEDVGSNENIEDDGTWKQELDNAREQYAIAITELDSAKQELRSIKKDYEISVAAKLSAFQQEAECKQFFVANSEKVGQLSKDIAATQDSLAHVKLATNQAQHEESKIRAEKDASKQSYKLALEETEKKLVSLKQEFNPEVQKILEAKLEEANTEIIAVQKEIEAVRASNLESLSTLKMEICDAKALLQKVAEEENSLRSLVESLKLELEAVRKEHAQLKEKDAETEYDVNNLHNKLQKCKAELEAAMSAESNATSASEDLISALHEVSSESQSAFLEAEAMKKSAEELRGEAELARNALVEAEKKLEVALKEAEEAKAAEALALGQIKDLSEKSSADRASTSESGGNITISKDEYESLSRKLEESEKLTEMKVAAAIAQVEAVRASENESIKRLETVRKEIEDMEIATEEALKRAQMAESAKKAVEGELRRWREKEQKRAAETAFMILTESETQTEAIPPRSVVQSVNPIEKAEDSRKVMKPTSSKKGLLQNLSGIFSRKNNRVDGGSPSYLPGEKPI